MDEREALKAAVTAIARRRHSTNDVIFVLLKELKIVLVEMYGETKGLTLFYDGLDEFYS